MDIDDSPTIPMKDYVSPYEGVEHAIYNTPEDYYAVLGVSNHASKSEIVTAYRALARLYHPDKSQKGENHEHAFKVISTAYTVLYDEKQRAAYDNERASSTFESPSFMTAEDQTRFNPKRDNNAFTLPKCAIYRTNATVNTQQVFTGTTLEVPIRRKVTCTHCNGTGGDSGTIEMCKMCRGCGVNVRRMKHIIDGEEEGGGQPSTIHFTHGCSTCGTTGYVVTKRTGYCTWCGSRGWCFEEDVLHVDVPPGIPSEGHRVIVEGKGHATPLRASGDVSINISVDWDPRLLRDGSDVHAVFRIRLLDALCGFRYSGDYFGEHMEFMSEPGQVIQTGDKLKVRCAGLPHMKTNKDAATERGDLYVVFRVDMPSSISTKDQQLLRVILDQTSLRTAEGREPIQQEELDMRGMAPGTVVEKEVHFPKKKVPKVYDSRADGCRPM